MDLKHRTKKLHSDQKKKELRRLHLSLSETVQMLSNIPGINNFNDTSKQEPVKQSTTKKGLTKRRAGSVIDVFTPAYPKHVNKCVKVFFERRSFHRQW